MHLSTSSEDEPEEIVVEVAGVDARTTILWRPSTGLPKPRSDHWLVSTLHGSKSTFQLYGQFSLSYLLTVCFLFVAEVLVTKTK